MWYVFKCKSAEKPYVDRTTSLECSIMLFFFYFEFKHKRIGENVIMHILHLSHQLHGVKVVRAQIFNKSIITCMCIRYLHVPIPYILCVCAHCFCFGGDVVLVMLTVYSMIAESPKKPILVICSEK